MLPAAPDAEPAAIRQRWPDGIDLLIVDHYGRGAAFERACRPWAKRIAVIDDLAGSEHDADVLLNPAAPSADLYRGLVPPTCKLLLGPEYSIVHPRFRKARVRALGRRNVGAVRRILLSFGQADATNAVMTALAALAAVKFESEINVVLGRASSQLSTIEAAAAGRAKVSVDVSDMAALMTDADLAIGGGGVTAWERCCLGLPSILVTLADNQRGVVATIVKAGAGIDAGSAAPGLERRLTQALELLLSDGSRLLALAKAGAALVDGRGRERVLLALVGPISNRRGQAVELRLAEPKDEEWLLALQSRPETRRHANDPSVPSANAHWQWFAQTLSSLDRLLMIIEVEGARAGMLRLDRGAATDRISIAVDPDYHRRGIGAASLALATRVSPGRPLEAEVLPENRASMALFAEAGFRKVDSNLFRREPE
ncbi:MAG: UDP-2,4-diacetamido-2,4,6-trideoxy-beta-L-altropyranose hydrolase [Deltaproteobacteria bacterium]|nr:UDP-2,4-diacetamido-2,4,6-trideoxy-beta-L-altropyranose hydrolase [Deltaproteobacteria bacterium]